MAGNRKWDEASLLAGIEKPRTSRTLSQMLTLCLHKKKGLPGNRKQTFVFYGAGDKIRTRDRLITNLEARPFLLIYEPYSVFIID